MLKPLVTVVIPAYNAEPFLGEAIQSALDQTHRPVEIVVIDDGSQDRTVEVARAFGPPIRCRSQPHAGAGAARNHAVGLAGGRFIALLDADDLWLPEKLRVQLAAFGQPPEPDIVFGLVEHFATLDGAPVSGVGATATSRPLPGHLTSSMVTRRETFARVGPFASDLRTGEFIDWMARAQELGLRCRTVDEVVVRRRIHGGNLTLRQRDAPSDLPRILKAALDRRRRSTDA